jgi:hypothetical protein
MDKNLIRAFLISISYISSISFAFGQCTLITSESGCSSGQPDNGGIDPLCQNGNDANYCIWKNNKCIPNCLPCTGTAEAECATAAFDPQFDPNCVNAPIPNYCVWQDNKCVPKCSQNSLNGKEPVKSQIKPMAQPNKEPKSLPRRK